MKSIALTIFLDTELSPSELTRTVSSPSRQRLCEVQKPESDNGE